MRDLSDVSEDEEHNARVSQEDVDDAGDVQDVSAGGDQGTSE